jgi:heptosyltransferase-3
MPTKNIIIYRLGSLGDTIVALPCFHKIADAFPKSNRIVLTNFPISTNVPALEAVLLGSGLVNGAISYPVGARSIFKLWRLAMAIRVLRPIALIYLMPNRGVVRPFRDFIFFRLCGIRRIIGFPYNADLRNLRRDRVSGFVERECERLARTLRALGPIDLSAPRAWDLKLTEQEKWAGKSVLNGFGDVPFIAISMGGKKAANDWGAARWIELLAVLAKTHASYGLLIVGGPADAARAKNVTQRWPNIVVDACHLNARESVAALQGASIFVGHDSGPLHLAAASQVACVGLFGNFKLPKQWHPYGERHHIIHRMEGISAISIEDVVAGVCSILPVVGQGPATSIARQENAKS